MSENKNAYQRSKKRSLGLIWFALTVLAAAGFLSLASWQYSRAGEKEALIATVEKARKAEPMAVNELLKLRQDDAQWEHRPLTLTGTYISQRQILLDNMVRKGKTGFEVLTPLKLSTGKLIMVNRGWIPWVGNRQNIPLIDAPSGPVTVVAHAHRFRQAGLVMTEESVAASPDWPLILNFPSQEVVNNLYSAPVLPIIARLDEKQAHGFDRQWLITGITPEKHLGYALQWLSLAITCLVLFVVLSIRKVQRES